jgi:hypothetical protein
MGRDMARGKPGSIARLKRISERQRRGCGLNSIFLANLKSFEPVIYEPV